MKKNIFALIILLFICSSVFSESVDTAKAGIVAKNFYYERIQSFVPIDLKDIHITSVYTEAESNITLFYIFSINNSGFVIVSAEDATYPVVGYSFESAYVPGLNNPAFSMWMENYKRQILSVAKTKIKPDYKVVNEWNRLISLGKSTIRNLRSTTPLIKTKWDQGIWYDEFCPADAGGPGGSCWAGCVPVAMAQVMNYYRYPQHGMGSYSYIHPVYGLQSADFANTTYDWSSMPVTLTYNNSALATLLYHLGVSVDLNYGPNGSGMYNHKAAYSLKTYFGYSPQTTYIFRDTTTINWRNMLIQHLTNGMPLYYAGWSDTNYISGHAFVCDAFQDTNYFHFNWGWSGSYDGYFSIDNLTPGGNNFTLLHEVVANIYPDTNYYPLYCNATDTLRSPFGSVDDGSGPLHNYADNADCKWLIAPDDSIDKITLNFLTFDMHDSDYVIVYDGSTTAAPVLGKFQGDSLPVSVTSTGNRMLIRIVSDLSGNSGGFLAGYTSVLHPFCSGVQNLTDSSGTLTDGSGTYDYRDNKLCRWNIVPANTAAINLHFTKFHVASDDWVRVFCGTTVQGTYSGDSLPQDILCSSSNISIWFKTDYYNREEGWEVMWNTSYMSVEDYSPELKFSIFPNPADEWVIIRISKQFIENNSEIEIDNIQGQLLKKQILNAEETLIKIDDLPQGIYSVKIKNSKNVAVKLMVVK